MGQSQVGQVPLAKGRAIGGVPNRWQVLLARQHQRPANPFGPVTCSATIR